MDLKEKWQQLASELGFEFKPGISAILKSPTMLKLLDQRQLSKNIEFLENPIIQKMFEALIMGTVTGIHRGFEFFLMKGSKGSSSSQDRYPFVFIALLFKNPRELGLEIYPASIFSSLGKMLMPQKYISIPNEELQKLIAVRGKDKDQIYVYLYEPKFQEKLIQLFRYSKGFKIGDPGIRYEQHGEIIDKNKALEIMDLMADTAEEWKG